MQGILFFTILTTINAYVPPALYTWKHLNYDFPNEALKAKYIPKNNLPVGLAVTDTKIFISIPRWKEGVAATLNYISKFDTDPSPKLKPYPNWESHNLNSNDPNIIVSLLHARPDTCDRLWVVDNGTANILTANRIFVRPPRLLIFDLKTDQVIRTCVFKSSDKICETFFTDVHIDIDNKNCEDAYAYINDPVGNGLLVYSYAKNDAWRFDHNFMRCNPFLANITITGVRFHWCNGIIGKALSLPLPDNSKKLFFHPSISTHVFSVQTSWLKDPKNIYNHDIFQIEGDKGLDTQALTPVMDKDTGVMYFLLMKKHGIGCWNTNLPLGPQNFKIVIDDVNKLEYLTDITIDYQEKQLYFLMSNFPKFAADQLDNNTRYIVYRENLNNLAACLG